METNLLDRMLDAYLQSQTPVNITLQNKVRVSGKIRAFDSYVVMLEGPKREIVYRHAMSSLSPASTEEQRKAAAAGIQPKAAASREQKTAGHKPKQPQLQPSLSPENGINNSMKEGLLRWLQEQKAAK